MGIYATLPPSTLFGHIQWHSEAISGSVLWTESWWCSGNHNIMLEIELEPKAFILKFIHKFTLLDVHFYIFCPKTNDKLIQNSSITWSLAH